MPRDRELLLDILESARLAIAYVQGLMREDFLHDAKCQDAVVRRLEVIGEAARRTSLALQTSFTQLPWKAMVGLRNVIAHEYDEIDLIVVWDTVQNDLPSLVRAVEEALASLAED
jgi:uncharacterized protein with HEPN domain